MRTTLLALWLVLPTAAHSAETEMEAPPLTLIFAKDQAVCRVAEQSMASEPACRAFDSASCPKPDALKFTPLASDQYGYTEVALAPEIPAAKFTLVYLQRFRGDQAPRLLETWKVDNARLQAVLALAPGVISFEDRYQFHPGPKSDLPMDTNAKEFRELLQAGERISGEWSAVADLLGEPHAVVRECAGAWHFGGYYRCSRVTKLSFVKLSAESTVERSCEFAFVETK